MKKWSKTWSIPLSKLKDAVSQSSSLTEVVQKLKLSKGGSIRILKKRLGVEKIDFSHIPLGRNSNTGRTDRTKSSANKKPLSKILVKNSTHHRGHLKDRLIKEGVLINKCSICDLDPQWNDKPMVLIIDHINGVKNDNRIKNLRLLCPNCNSQTDTFSGRNKKSVA